MTFNESNTVEQMILDAATKLVRDPRSARWTYVPAEKVPRLPGDIMVEPWLRDALIRLNPEIAADPDRADEVIYKLRAILLSVNADGLVRANENFMAWLRGDKTMPFGPGGEHVPAPCLTPLIRPNNRLIVTNSGPIRLGRWEKRFDVVFVSTGMPLVISEAKTPPEAR